MDDIGPDVKSQKPIRTFHGDRRVKAPFGESIGLHGTLEASTDANLIDFVCRLIQYVDNSLIFIFLHPYIYSFHFLQTSIRKSPQWVPLNSFQPLCVTQLCNYPFTQRNPSPQTWHFNSIKVVNWNTFLDGHKLNDFCFLDFAKRLRTLNQNYVFQHSFLEHSRIYRHSCEMAYEVC